LQQPTENIRLEKNRSITYRALLYAFAVLMINAALIFHAFQLGHKHNHKFQFNAESGVFIAMCLIAAAFGVFHLRNLIRLKLEIRCRMLLQKSLQGVNEELEVKVAERTAALQLSNNHINNVLSNIDAVVYSCRPGGDYALTFVSENVNSLLGYEPSDFLNNPSFWINHIHQDDLDLIKDKSSSLMEREGAICEYRYHHRDGSYLWLLDEFKLIKDEKGNSVEIIGFFQDITAGKETKNKLKEAEDALCAHQEQLSALAAMLSLAEERERRRIAGELHDRIGQTLAFAKIKLDMLHQCLESTEHAQATGEISKAIETSIQEVRTLTVQISPPLLYEIGLEAALEWLCEWARDNQGLEVAFHDDRQPKQMGEEIRSTLFQAVRELLINIAKHSQAKKAAISIKKHDNNLILQVEDEGAGFDMTKVAIKRENSLGFGLFNIKQRIRHLGGEFHAESELGRGTLVRLVVPLPGQDGPGRRKHNGRIGGKLHGHKDSAG